MENKIETLLSQMTLEEKASMLAGADLWHSVPVERLGIPILKVTDGPVGARGASGSSGPTSDCFPCGTALASTWNPELIQRVGECLAEEVKAKGAHILLAPTVNIHRSPLAGRNFECYSEDPYLTGRMATAYIQGLQSRGVGACIKHFVCNDTEFERNSISSEIGERPLREIYLRPFQMAMRDAKPWTLMSAYNKLNGVWCSENTTLLGDILKGEWGFDGAVISDWFGSYTPAVANGGLDLEMPGPGRWLGVKQVMEMVQSGQVSQATIDDKVRRLLRTLFRVGAFDYPALKIEQLPTEQAIDRAEHRQAAYQAASEAIVLLKNHTNLLPLEHSRIKSIAVIGENARWAQIRGGGSADVTPHYVVTPLQGIQQAAGKDVTVSYALGTPIHRSLPFLDASWLSAADGRRGFDVLLYDNLELSGQPASTWFTDRANIAWPDAYLTGVNPQKFSARITARLSPPESGRYHFSAIGSGQHRLAIDGKVLVDAWRSEQMGKAPWDQDEIRAEIDLLASQTYEISLDYAWQGEMPWRSLQIGCELPMPADPIQEAVALAARSDVAIVVAGQTNEWEGEGSDRPDMELPGKQAELIERVARANPNTIVVLNTGSPVRMPWLEQIPALVQIWYTGQESGRALADILFGEVNPSGKLPTTFPVRLEDNPAYLNYPGENGRVLYGEGLFVGYRYYDKKDIAPQFPFGYGLSYTSFAYRNLKVEANRYSVQEMPVRISLEVQNTGQRAGQEVVQLYLRDVQSSLARPLKELKAFAKVALQAGETKTVTFTLHEDALVFYDDKRQAWISESGVFEALVGSSSRHIHLSGQFEWQAPPPPVVQAKATRMHTGLSLGELLENPASLEVLKRRLDPALFQHPELEMAKGFALDQIAPLLPEVLTPEMMKAINEELGTL